MSEEIKDLEVVESHEVSNEPSEVEARELSLEDMLAPTNIPYTKILNEEGDLANPITKSEPYLNPFMNRREKKKLLRAAKRNPKNNKKGVRLIITNLGKGRFTKTRVFKQVAPDGKTIIHNELQ